MLQPAFVFIQPLLSPLRARNQHLCKRPRARRRAQNALTICAAKYIPSDDDKAETASENPKQLTLPQQLLMKQYEEQVERMSPQQCRDLCIEIARQMMVKDNILRQMLNSEVDFGDGPPDPEDLQPPHE